MSLIIPNDVRQECAFAQIRRYSNLIDSKKLNNNRLDYLNATLLLFFPYKENLTDFPYKLKY